MSLVITISHPQGIVMATDSRFIRYLTRVDPITLEPIGGKEEQPYEGQKIFDIRGRGCISFWGEATNTVNQLSTFVSKLKQSDYINRIAEKFFDYLKNEIKAHEMGTEVGFHIGGFAPDGTRRVYHAFYGFQIGEENRGKQYYLNREDDGSKPDRILALYNGQPRITDMLVQFSLLLYDEINNSHKLLANLDDCVRLAKFVIRFTSKVKDANEKTPSVGDDIQLRVLKCDKNANTVIQGEKYKNKLTVPVRALQYASIIDTSANLFVPSGTAIDPSGIVANLYAPLSGSIWYKNNP